MRIRLLLFVTLAVLALTSFSLGTPTRSDQGASGRGGFSPNCGGGSPPCETLVLITSNSNYTEYAYFNTPNPPPPYGSPAEYLFVTSAGNGSVVQLPLNLSANGSYGNWFCGDSSLPDYSDWFGGGYCTQPLNDESNFNISLQSDGMHFQISNGDTIVNPNPNSSAPGPWVVYADPSLVTGSTPEPASLVLLASGLALAIRRRRSY
jgi:PEP-CTERM motif